MFHKRVVLVLAALAALTPSLSFADDADDSPYAAEVSGDLGKIGVEVSGRGAQTLRSPIRIGVRFPGTSRTVILTTQIPKTWNASFTTPQGRVADKSSVTLYRGYMNENGTQLPVAGSLIDDGASSKFRLVYRDDKRSTDRFIAIEMDPSEAQTTQSARVHRTSTSRYPALKCGSELHQSAAFASSAAQSGSGSSGEAGSTPEALPATLRTIQLSTDADYEWFQAYGTSSNSQIAAFINELETIYENQLDLTISIVDQNTWSSSSDPYTSSVSSTLLTQFQNYVLNHTSFLGAADLYHLFTGKDLEETVVGLAYLGVACVAPQYAFGLTQDVDATLNHVITAHEMGHNLNAEHTSSGIMGAALGNPPPTSFSATSVSQITSFVTDYGSCLSTGGGSGDGDDSPDPDPGASPTPTPGGDDDGDGDGGGNGGGGSGSGGDEDGEPMPILIDSSLDTSGNFSAEISLLTLDTSCTITVLGAPKMNRVFTTGVELLSFNPTSITHTVSGTIAARLKSDTTPAKIFFGALLNCGGTEEASNTKAQRVRVRARSGFKAKRWLQTLASTLVVQ